MSYNFMLNIFISIKFIHVNINFDIINDIFLKMFLVNLQPILIKKIRLKYNIFIIILL
jgi:hypothetical protein